MVPDFQMHINEEDTLTILPTRPWHLRLMRRLTAMGSIEFCANVTCGADSISGPKMFGIGARHPIIAISQSDNQSICYVIDAVYNGDIGDESEEQIQRHYPDGQLRLRCLRHV